MLSNHYNSMSAPSYCYLITILFIKSENALQPTSLPSTTVNNVSGFKDLYLFNHENYVTKEIKTKN